MPAFRSHGGNHAARKIDLIPPERQPATRHMPVAVRRLEIVDVEFETVPASLRSAPYRVYNDNRLPVAGAPRPGSRPVTSVRPGWHGLIAQADGALSGRAFTAVAVAAFLLVAAVAFRSIVAVPSAPALAGVPPMTMLVTRDVPAAQQTPTGTATTIVVDVISGGQRVSTTVPLRP